jgi:hypothetical protein
MIPCAVGQTPELIQGQLTEGYGRERWLSTEWMQLPKNHGHIPNGRQQCEAWRGQFDWRADHRVVHDEQRMLIAGLLCEKISLRGAGLTVGVGRSWLLGFIVEPLDG